MRLLPPSTPLHRAGGKKTQHDGTTSWLTSRFQRLQVICRHRNSGRDDENPLFSARPTMQLRIGRARIAHSARFARIHEARANTCVIEMSRVVFHTKTPIVVTRHVVMPRALAVHPPPG